MVTLQGKVIKRIAPDSITELKPNEVFVFGSNEKGIHGAGAAKQALKWGARWGEGIGLFGQTYALPSKDKRVETLPLGKIQNYVDEFIFFAKKNSDLDFLVTKIGMGLAGLTLEDIAPMFRKAIEIKNIYLPKAFLEYYEISSTGPKSS